MENVQSELKFSESGSENFDKTKLFSSVDAFMAGMDSAFGIWSTIVVMLTLSMLVPPNYEQISWALQIITLIISIVSTITDYIFAKYNEYETFWYWLGAGIVTIFTGLNFHRMGKADKYTLLDHSDNFSEYVKRFRDMNEKTIWGELGGDLLREFPFRLGRKLVQIVLEIFNETITEEERYALYLGIDVGHLIWSAIDWAESFHFLNCLKYLPSTRIPIS
ncbi:MAG: hypothetical protein ACFFBI_04215 [Promethearchaeota archaeon]